MNRGLLIPLLPFMHIINYMAKTANPQDRYKWIDEEPPKTEQELLRENIDREWKW